MLALSAVTMVSCDGGKDAEYVPGGDSNGAFFATTAPVYYLTPEQSSITIPLERPSKDCPDVVNIAMTDPSGLFSVPSKVTFAPDAVAMDLELTFDSESIKYDTKYQVNLAIDYGNMYKNSYYNFTVVRLSPWHSIGKGIYTDGLMVGLYNISQLTYFVEIQENDNTPNLYRVVNPYGPGVFEYTDDTNMVSNDDYYMIVHCEDPERVYVEDFSTNMIWDPSLGVMSFASVAYFNLAGGVNPDLLAANGYFGNNKDGVITMPDGSGSKGFIWQGEGDYAGWKYLSNGYGWKLLLPGVEDTDYSANMTYNGRFTDVNETTFMVVNVEIGPDVKFARVAAAQTNDLAALQQAIVNDEIEYQKITKSGEVKVPVTESGIYTIMVVTFAKGEAQEIATTTAEISLGGSEWENLGDCYILDGWMLSAAKNYADQYQEMMWKCPIQRSTKKQGIYRLVQPYGPNSIMGNFAEPGVYNIEINATDVKNVYIEPQSTGNGFFSDGIMTIATAGALRELSEELRGTFDGETFWFPATTCFVTFDGETYYSTRNAGGFQIESVNEQSKSFKAIKTSNAIGSKQHLSATPYDLSHKLRRHIPMERIH